MATYGVSGAGRMGVDRRRTRARSLPTGWETRQGEVTGQELEFENGYRVLNVTIPGQKATIKGHDAWVAVLKNLDQWTAVVREWVASEEKNHKGRTAAGAQRSDEAHADDSGLEARLGALEKNMNRLIETLTAPRT